MADITARYQGAPQTGPYGTNQNAPGPIPGASIDVPKIVGAVKSGISKTVAGVKVLGKLGAAIATEPFTNKLLNANGAAIDARQAREAAATKSRGLTNRYPSK